MKLCDVICPQCGKVNRGLLLHETGGWMECDRCGVSARFTGGRSGIPAVLREKPAVKASDRSGA